MRVLPNPAAALCSPQPPCNPIPEISDGRFIAAVSFPSAVCRVPCCSTRVGRRKLGDYLIVGIFNDELVNRHR